MRLNLLLLVICLVLLIIIYFNNLYYETFINNDKQWEGYRLGDIVKYWNNMKYQKKSYEYSNSIPTRYPNSIGHKYLKRNNTRKTNYKLLFRIVNEEIKNQQIPKNNISLHLRLGDVINKDYSHGYVTKFEKLENILKKFKNKEVNVFYGAHYIQKEKGMDNNLKYLEKIKDILKKYNIKYIMRNSGNPDLDFLNMCHSDIFIQSGGGFSKLIASYVKSNNKNVL